MRRDQLFDDLLAHVGDLVADVVGRHDFAALFEDHTPLVVEHIVEFEDVLAELEIARFDLLLRFLERLVDPRMCDSFALFESKPLEDRIHAFRPENPHQVILQAQIEY